MADFRNIKTNYVKNKLKRLEYNEGSKEYIEDLMFIERVISGEKINYIAEIGYGLKIRKYEREFKEIFKELDPIGYEAYLFDIEQKRKQLEAREKQWALTIKAEECISRGSWEQIKRE